MNKKWISILIATQLFSNVVLAKGKIQDADVKSLSDITSAVLTTTGNLTSGNACITSPGSTSGLATGLYIYDTTSSSKISSGTTIAGLPGTCSAGQIQMSANATASATGDTITFGGQASQLLNITKFWDTLNSQQFSTSWTNGQMGSGAASNGTVLIANGSGATSWGSPVAAPSINIFYNSGFDFWTRGTSVTIANGASTYQPDQWYVRNGLGTNGVITFSQVSGGVAGSKFGASVKITTAPTAAQTNGTELFQVLENVDSLWFYNQTASMGAQIKALGNVNQVGLQFYYATSEVKLTTAIGSETTCSVSSGAFTNCTKLAQAMGTSQTASGVVGIRIRITGVSTGNTYDLNNGFIAEQVQMNIGSTLPAYQRRAGTGEELTALKRFYRQIFAYTGMAFDANNIDLFLSFDPPMRGTPSLVSTGSQGFLNGAGSASQSSQSNDVGSLQGTNAAKFRFGNFTALTVGAIYIHNTNDGQHMNIDASL